MYNAGIGGSDQWQIARNRLYDSALKRAITVNGAVEDLTLHERELLALWRLESDLSRGGFLRFFCGWGDTIYQIALDALTRVRADHLADALRQMRAIVAPHEWRISESDREPHDLLTNAECAALDSLSRSFTEHLDELTRLVVDCYEPRAS